MHPFLIEIKIIQTFSLLTMFISSKAYRYIIFTIVITHLQTNHHASSWCCILQSAVWIWHTYSCIYFNDKIQNPIIMDSYFYILKKNVYIFFFLFVLFRGGLSKGKDIWACAFRSSTVEWRPKVHGHFSEGCLRFFLVFCYIHKIQWRSKLIQLLHQKWTSKNDYLLYGYDFKIFPLQKELIKITSR